MEAAATAFLFALIVTWMASAIFCVWLADVKGRDGNLWLIWGLLFGIAALIAIAGAPPAAKRLGRQCHSYDESISVKALVCPWCGARQINPQSPPPPDLDAVQAEQSSAANAENQTAVDRKGELKLIAVSIFVVAIIFAIVWFIGVVVG